jgi:hypothetical protein
MWRREKNGEVQEKFFQNFRCIEKFFGGEGDIYKIFKSWGVQNLIFLSDDLFFK